MKIFHVATRTETFQWIVVNDFIVDSDVLASGQVPRNYLAHEHGHLVRRVELACFLACVGGEVADKVLVDEAQDVVLVFVCLDFRAHLVGGFPYL
ncbi:hypothetical protein HMPREF2933_01175 [Streptococcus sp. HMSC066F10]|nr:hypothetical protein HMPREF2970_05385 [Streptococcus sp. HMSC056D07]OFQ53637.1 hypothetical protein HMPREF2933_01175 [Streptococcus sp. HMSC066F10]OHO24580.1 hypothetical protein HMPREF2610_08990 [Streptococcus sp. HMSC034A12]OHO27209.1 hypothetical protein HMPREF2643_07385 [Streptococcus sp. HMSC034B04]OHR63292.1 hypothetical protein HMPREF2783_00175 [Streptococcus sp. HMSC034F03]